MKEVVIVSACRTAIGGFGGSLKNSNGLTLAETVIRGVVSRSGIDPSEIEDVRFGCCFEPIDSSNIARVAALKAGIPDTATGTTMNRVCCSAMEALASGVAMIRAEMVDVVVAGGVEHMSGVPYVLPKARWGADYRIFPVKIR
jgi:acetyl-CoA C-acetyltransferase